MRKHKIREILASGGLSLIFTPKRQPTTEGGDASCPTNPEPRPSSAQTDDSTQPCSPAPSLMGGGAEEPDRTVGELDPEEREMMDLLLSFTRRLDDWGLKANQSEMTAAIHVLQGFVVQHMLQRIAPQAWSGWYAPSTFGEGADNRGRTMPSGMRVSRWNHPAR